MQDNIVNINSVLKLAPRTTAPSSPSAGYMYFDSNDGKAYIYDGGTWRALW